jgi:RNA polymerase sigma-70 factor (ECF subfamily)
MTPVSQHCSLLRCYPPRRRTPLSGAASNVDAISRESYGGLSDARIVELCLDRDQLAWSQVVARFKRRVFNIAYKFTGRHGDAEDLTQEVFLRIFRSLDKFNRGANFGTWLTSVARNHCIDHYRATKREREVLVSDLAHFETAAAHSGNPQSLIEDYDRSGLVRRALDRLPTKLREAVVLRDLTELTYQEMAEQLGLPEGTVKSRINRGRAELARILLRARQDARRAISEQTRARGRQGR